jgi:hypothetical protein
MTTPIRPRREYPRRCRLEDLLAHLYDARLTIEVIIAKVRPLGHACLLAECYRLRRELDILKKYISQEWHYENGSEEEA